ncbi:GFA family protein [Ideonella sp.]|uniref:GFA family protein n=1 Tax=Ideonella sp. TaxID=1929293 RepID=UPI0035B46F4C
MLLEGSCHCRAVRFSVESRSPVPFMRCYCSICRKTAGTGGFAINLGADFATLKAQGQEHLSVYRAIMEDGHESTGQRHFCKRCGTALWLWDPTWPELVHPHAGAVDTPLPVPPSVTHMMLGSKPAWVEANIGADDREFDEYPDESLAEWHQRHGLAG